MTNRSIAKVMVAGALAVTASVSTACSGGSPVHKDAQASGQAQRAQAAAVRWWSNSAARSGSSIDPTNPDSATGKLSPSQPEYCSMLGQTIAARKSILPNVGANDPSLLTTTEAFTAEMQRVAPAEVSAAWQVLGPALVNLVRSKGELPTETQAAALKQAADTISAHAKQTCGVDIAAKP